MANSTRDIYNVKAYGAAGDGSFDDYAAIQRAITAAKGHGGGIVGLPEGRYIVGAPINLENAVYLRGSGRATEIRRKARTNFGTQGVIQTQGTKYGFGIENLVVDGNYGGPKGPGLPYTAAQGDDAVGASTGSRGLSLDGAAYRVNNVSIERCKDIGWYSTLTTTDADPGIPVMYEAMTSNFTVGNCYGEAHLKWDGPTDCVFSNFFVYNLDYTSRLAALFPANKGMLFNAGGSKCIGGHIFGEALLVGLHSKGNNMFSAMTVESCSGNPGLAGDVNSANVVLANSGNIFDGYVYDNTANHTVKTGFRVGTAGVETCQESTITALIANCAVGVNWGFTGQRMRVHATITGGGAATAGAAPPAPSDLNFI